MEAELNMENISACAQNSCGLDKYKDIVQLYDKDRLTGRVRKVFPITYIQAVYDGKTGASLESILAQYNNVFLQFMGTAEATRVLLPKEMRRKGIQISYRNMEDEVIVEKCVNDSRTDDTHWGLSANWARIDELSLSGEISVSAKGTWIINGEDTGIKAVGPKGDNGLTPWLKTIDNKLYHSYDNKTWEPSSDYIAAWFRFTGTSGSSQAGNVGKIQISRDEGKTWTDLSGTFTNNLRISGYRTSVDLIPEGQPQGAIWAIGPTYASDDTAHTNPIYRLHVKDESGWVDNGQFTSIAAGVVQELGDSETEVISQKTITEEFDKVFNPYQIDGEFLAYSDGSIHIDADYVRSDFLPISKNQPIECYASYGSGSTSLAFYDKDKNFISAIPKIEGRNFELVSVAVADIPAEAVYIRTAIRKDSPYKYLRGFDLNALYSNISDTINEVKETIHNPVFNLNNNVENKYWTLEEAVAAVPEEYKKQGLTIVFNTALYDWKAYTFTGNDLVNQWSNTSLWINDLNETTSVKRISELYKDGGNIFNYETVNAGYYVNYPSGKLVINKDQINDWNASDYIRVTPNTKLMANATLYDRSFYDKDFNTIESFTGKLDANTPIDVPENASYFRFSMYKLNIKNVCLKVQSEGTVVFEKYSRSYKWLPFSNEKLESIISNYYPTVKYDNLQVKIPVTASTARGASDIRRWGAAFNKVAGLEFNAIRMPAGSTTEAPIGKVPKYIQATVKQSYSDSEPIAVSPLLEIKSFPLQEFIFPLQDPVTGESKTLAESDFTGETYWINISYYTDYQQSVGYAGVSMANPVLSNYVAGSSKYNTKDDDTFWSEWYSTPCPAFEHLLLTNATIEYILKASEVTEKIDISLPDTISAVVGDTLQLFIRGIVKAVNPYNYDVVITCSKGQMYPRYFEFTPSAQDIGTIPFNIKVKNSDGTVLSQKDCNIVVKSAVKAPTSQKNVLCLGDSLTDDRVWSKEMFRHLAQTGGTPAGLGYSNIEFVGRKKFTSGDVTQGVEGNRGWSWKDYLTVGRKAFTFTITAPSIMPSVEAVYKDTNNKTYTMWWDYSTTSIKMIVDDMVSTPPASGTLTKVSGNGDSTLNYSAVVESSGNPFWDDSTSSLNFKNYVDKWCGGQVDIIYVLLTWNGQTGNRTDFSAFTNYAKTLFTHIKSQYPNIIIRLMGVQVPDLRQGERVDGSPKENTYTDQYGLVCTCLNMNEAYQKLANEDGYSSYVKFVNVSSQVDSEYNMPYTPKAVNTRNSSVTEDIGTNDVHPSDAGYLQIGDIGYRNFVVDFCQ